MGAVESRIGGSVFGYSQGSGFLQCSTGLRLPPVGQAGMLLPGRAVPGFTLEVVERHPGRHIYIYMDSGTLVLLFIPTIRES